MAAPAPKSAPAARPGPARGPMTVAQLKKHTKDAFAKTEIFAGNWMPPVGEYRCRMSDWSEDVKVDRKSSDQYWLGSLELTIVDHPDPDLNGKAFKKMYNSRPWKDPKSGEVKYLGYSDLKSDLAAIIGAEEAEASSIEDATEGMGACCTPDSPTDVAVEISSRKDNKGNERKNCKIMMALGAETQSDDSAVEDEGVTEEELEVEAS